MRIGCEFMNQSELGMLKGACEHGSSTHLVLADCDCPGLFDTYHPSTALSLGFGMPNVETLTNFYQTAEMVVETVDGLQHTRRLITSNCLDFTLPARSPRLYPGITVVYGIRRPAPSLPWTGQKSVVVPTRLRSTSMFRMLFFKEP